MAARLTNEEVLLRIAEHAATAAGFQAEADKAYKARDAEIRRARARTPAIALRPIAAVAGTTHETVRNIAGEVKR